MAQDRWPADPAVSQSQKIPKKFVPAGSTPREPRRDTLVTP
jgi:hypothetical protein